MKLDTEQEQSFFERNFRFILSDKNIVPLYDVYTVDLEKLSFDGDCCDCSPGVPCTRTAKTLKLLILSSRNNRTGKLGVLDEAR
jgi:hypothetical protein